MEEERGVEKQVVLLNSPKKIILES